MEKLQGTEIEFISYDEFDDIPKEALEKVKEVIARKKKEEDKKLIKMSMLQLEETAIKRKMVLTQKSAVKPLVKGIRLSLLYLDLKQSVDNQIGQ